MKPATKAWLAIGVGVAAYDLLSPKGETLSERMNEWSSEYPIAIHLAIGYLALHLAGRIPDQIDPLTLMTKGLPRSEPKVYGKQYEV